MTVPCSGPGCVCRPMLTPGEISASPSTTSMLVPGTSDFCSIVRLIGGGCCACTPATVISKAIAASSAIVLSMFLSPGFSRFGREPLLLGETRDQAGRVPAPAAHLLHLGVIGVDECGDVHFRPVALGLVHDDGEVLAHPVHREAEIELALVHGLPAVVHLPGLGRTLADGLHHLGD